MNFLALLKSPKIIAGLCTALAFTVLLSAVFLYRGNSIKAEARAAVVQTQLDKALKVNEDNAAAFRRMQLTQEANDKLLQQLASNYTAINTATATTQQQLKNVAAQNAEVKALLSTRLPASLSGLLNGSQNHN